MAMILLLIGGMGVQDENEGRVCSFAMPLSPPDTDMYL